MPYKPTGRPVGRPKTKDYKTISLKMPQDLLDRVQTYAREHRQSVSELIRDGLEWRITEGDPRRQHMSVKSYSSNTVLEEMVQPVHLVEEGMPFDEDVAAVPVPRPHDGNTVLPEEMQSQHETPPAQPQDGNTVLPTHIPPRRRGRHSGEIRQRILTL